MYVFLKQECIFLIIEIHVSWKQKQIYPEKEMKKSLDTHEHIVDNLWDILSMVDPRFSFYNCSSVWWCSESNISHHSDDIFKRFTKVFMLFIIFHNHWYKLNRTDLMVIFNISISTFDKNNIF